MNEEIRLEHAIMDYDNEIKCCKEVLASGVTGEDREHAEARLKDAEKWKKRLLKERDRLLNPKWRSYEDMLKQKEEAQAKKKAKTIKVVYAEPADYIPKDLRQKYKLGEFAERKEDKK